MGKPCLSGRGHCDGYCVFAGSEGWEEEEEEEEEAGSC